ncbi:hypothetical protein Bca4012_025953 [Brassica carinata]
MLVVGEKNLHLILNIPMDVYGDQKRIQQLIAEFLLIIVHYAPTEGSVELNLHRQRKYKTCSTIAYGRVVKQSPISMVNGVFNGVTT